MKLIANLDLNQTKQRTIMKTLKLLIFLFIFCYGAEANQNLFFEVNKFETIKFDKTITNIEVSDSSKVEISFVQNDQEPFKEIKVLTKNVGNASLFVTFSDNSVENIYLSITKNLQEIISSLQQKNPNLIITQSNENIILKGEIESSDQREKIYDAFVKAGIEVEKKLIDFAKIKEMKKMIKLKLYIVSINTSKGQTIKNNWALGYKNGGTASTMFDDVMKTTMVNAVSLSGGLTAMANQLEGGFNTSLVLNYLSTNGVAKVVDETTLLTAENKHAKFHSGGEIMIEKTSLSNETTTSEYIPREYDIVLDVLASKIINDEFVDLNIITTSSKLDWGSVTVGEDVKSNIPGFATQSIETNVIIKKNNTVILGGLTNEQNLKDDSKVPLLGDIPILGWLFRSKDYQEGKNELVFFITPEIVEASLASDSDRLKANVAN